MEENEKQIDDTNENNVPSEVDAAEPPRDTSKKSDVKWIVAVIVVLAVVVVGLLYKQGYLSFGEEEKGISVLVITLDGVRTDRLGCIGYDPDVTPNINKLAKSGFLFTQCTTPTPQSTPAMASLMTATYPFVNGFRFSGTKPLGAGHITLGEILRNKNYSTAGRFGSPDFFKQCQLDQGLFETNVSLSGVPGQGGPGGQRQQNRQPAPSNFNAEEVVNSAIIWLRARKDEPFFLWTHINDASAPSMPPAGYAEKFPKDPFMGELAFVDHQVGKLLDELDSLGLREKTLVVLTSGFGESLGQHKETVHSWFLYDSTTRVPLIFSMPERITGGGTNDAQVRLIDVVPTILDLIDAEPKTDIRNAKSLVSLIDDPAGDSQLSAYSESLVPFIQLDPSLAPPRSLRKDGWKYIQAPTPELYDLNNDPAEAKNVAAEHPDRVEAMRTEMFELLIGKPELPDPEEGEVLVSQSGDLNEVALLRMNDKDPKDHKDEINLFTQAQLLIAIGKSVTAVDHLQKLIEINPDLVNPLKTLMQLMQQQGRTDELVPILEKILEQRPERHDARFTLATLLEGFGDRKAAIEQLKILEQYEIGIDTTLVTLGNMLHAEGLHDEAEARFRKLIEKHPDEPRLHVMLVVVLTDADKIEEAAGFYREQLQKKQGEEKEVTLLDSYRMLGKALADQGHSVQAIRHLEKAVELDPESAITLLTLGMIQARTNLLDKALATLTLAAEKNPTSSDIAFNRANVLKQMLRYREAVDVLRSSLETTPEGKNTLMLLAWILATCPDDSLRSGAEALEMATKACELFQNRSVESLNALAAAYAETGDFEKAKKTAAMAIRQAQASRNRGLAMQINNLLRTCYANNKPFRDQSADTSGGDQ